MQLRYVVDTNVLVAWLLHPSGLAAKIIRSMELQLYSPYKAISELWEHRNEWVGKKPKVNLREFTEALGYYVTIVPVDRMSREMDVARSVMDPTDPDDSEFFALALLENADIWSYDKDFQRQSRIKVVTSEEISKRSHEWPSLWLALRE